MDVSRALRRAGWRHTRKWNNGGHDADGAPWNDGFCEHTWRRGDAEISAYSDFEGGPDAFVNFVERSVNIRCRCEVCREAHRSRTKRELANRTDRLRADPTLAAHGDAYTYHNWGCRCARCTDAWNVQCAKYKAKARAAA